MSEKIIRLCYRKIIDTSSQELWDKYVYDSSYKEFLLQSQFYNQEKKYTRFSDLLLYVKGAEKLHFLVSAAVTGYLQQLGNKIPDIRNNQAKLFLTFTDYQFEIIQSDIKNKSHHRVSISFYSESLIWHASPGNFLLVSPANIIAGSDGHLCTLLQLQPYLDIYSIKQTTHDNAFAG